jgi:hypothetical protein
MFKEAYQKLQFEQTPEDFLKTVKSTYIRKLRETIKYGTVDKKLIFR